MNGILASIDDLLWIAETSPNAPLDDAGNLPLHYAATHGSIDAIYGLLELGADATLENNVGRKASEVARDLGHIGAAIALRKAESSAIKYPDVRKVTAPTASKHSGEFTPTYNTNLIQDEADWSIPDGIDDEARDEPALLSLNTKRKILSNALESISTNPEDGLICLYERMWGIFSNINIVLGELKKINSEILMTQEDCENYLDYDDQICITIDRIKFSNFIISVLEKFALLVEGDLLNNVESGDQDLIDARIKLVPPLYEGLKDLDRSDDCFQKEWSDILKSNSLWDREHWSLPDD